MKAPASSAQILQLHPNLQWPEREEAASSLSQAVQSSQTPPVALTYGADTSGCFIQIQLQGAVLSIYNCTTEMHHPSNLSIVAQSI